MRRLMASMIVAVVAIAMFVAPAAADHNGAQIMIDGGECDPTLITASIADPEGTHQVDNMRLVVDDGTDVHLTGAIPTDGSTVDIAVGPFDEDTLVLWRIFGGGERDYDNPFWHGYDEPGFTDDINAYAASVDGFGWVLAGFDDPNPFTTWHELLIEACEADAPQEPDAKDACKNGGWSEIGFRNQGLCIQLVNTGKDSRAGLPPR